MTPGRSGVPGREPDAPAELDSRVESLTVTASRDLRLSLRLVSSQSPSMCARGSQT